MADIVLDEQTTPTAPSAGQLVIYPDSSASVLLNRDDAGRVNGLISTASVADQTLGVADTYVTGSRVLIPSVGLQVGSRIRWYWSVSKTAAGVAAPVYTARLGTAGTTADTSVWTHTGVVQTAIAEVGRFELDLVIRTIGASGVAHGVLTVVRNGGIAATGLAAVPASVVTGAAASNVWASGQGIGLSINPGASSAWTVGQIQADLDI